MNLDKLPRLIYELERTAARQVIPVTAWHVFEGELEPTSVRDVAFQDLPTRRVPFLWGGVGVTNWFFARLSLPKPGAGETLILHLDVGEGLVFLDGEPYHGTDVHHRDIPLPDRTSALVAVEAYSGPGPEKTLFRSAELRLVDTVAERILRMLRNLRDVLEFFPEDDETRLQLGRVLRSALAQIDPRRPGSERWYTSLRRAEEALREGLSGLHSSVSGEVLAVGHSHIDVAWLWRIKEVQRKCGRTFSTALRLLDEFETFRFVQSQPQLYAYTKERYPALYEQIQRRVREGRWEPVGAMWVEADCNLTSGESLVRQLLYGKRFFEQEFGVNVRNLWLPDVFGYSWALPQLLRKAEVEGFFTAKIGWNKQNPFPHSTFWWQGVDGSQVLSHLSFHPHLYNIQLTPKHVREAWNRFRQKGTSHYLLLPFGFGDGGGGVTRDHAANLDLLKNLPGLPKLQPGGVQAFFDSVRAEEAALPTWNNELYFEYHRGTLTSQAAVKRANRKTELALREAEYFSTLGTLHGLRYPAAELEEAWKLLLTNQFHDILPGSSIPEVYEDALRDFDRAKSTAEKAKQAAVAHLLGKLSGDGEHLVVFNSLSWERTDVARVKVDVLPGQTPVVLDPDGRAVPCQLVEEANGDTFLLFLVEQMPALGSRTYTLSFQEGEENQHVTPSRVDQLETEFFALSLNELSEITSLFDKRASRPVFTAPGNVFQAFLDYPHAWEAWDIDEDFEDHSLGPFEPVAQRVLSDGPVAVVVETTVRLESSTITQRLYAYKHLPRLDFDTEIDWHESRVLLKVAFPLNVHTRRATYEIQFGAIDRPTHRNTSWAAAQYEVAGQRWADLSEPDYGVSLLNDCKYGHDARDNVLRLSLLRSPYPPPPQDAGMGAQWNRPADQGKHRVVYSLYPHTGSWQDAHSPRAGWELNVPLSVFRAGTPPNTDVPGLGKSLLGIEPGSSVILDTVKKAEDSDDLILRFYESEGRRAQVDVVPSFEFTKAFETNLLERQEQLLTSREGRIPLAFGPFEVKTVKLVLR